MIRASSFRREGRRPFVMGILNVTPDSFSEGGLHNDPESAAEFAVRMVEDGADIIDIGGESTRPGAVPVPASEELSRLVPVLEILLPRIDVPVSVDTMKADVARVCVGMGVSIINDVSSLSDPGMARCAAELEVPIVLMSSHGSPGTFSSDFIEGNAVSFARSRLEALIASAGDAGVRDDMIITDPGVGFGTDPLQGMAMVENASEFSFGRYPVLIGPSRKRFLRTIYPGDDPDSATVRACLAAVNGGADIVRTHAPGMLKGVF